jgi:nucleotide-binding universal stress UspA family protein
MGTPRVIVVGTDYSEYATSALKVAYAQAVQHGPADFHVVHVTPASNASAVGYPAPVLAGLSAVPALSVEEQQAELVEHLDRELATLPGFHTGQVRVFAHVVLDAPALGVARLASALHADLIVVGSHGRHGVVRWLLGSVAEGVVRQASCPVLVVPPAPPALSAPPLEPTCPECLKLRKASGGAELWCEQHCKRHGRRHTYYQPDRGSTDINFPLVVR